MINKQKLIEEIEKDCVFKTFCLNEDLEIEGNCSAIDEKTDRETATWIHNELEHGNQWAWCTVRVVCYYKDLTADDYLGCCSYKSREDFESPGNYYDDMKAECLNQLANTIIELSGVIKDCTE